MIPLSKILKKIARKILNVFGFVVFKQKTLAKKLYPDLARRMQIIESQSIHIVIDIGANNGQYAQQIRNLGYKNKIISFEPLNTAFEALSKVAANDPKWTIYKKALGDKKELSIINVSENSMSSSIMDMLPAHLESAPQSKFIDTQEIAIDTLDAFLQEIDVENSNLMVKIDAQGYEKKILDGTLLHFSKIKIFQLEMSLAPLYKGEIDFIEMIHFMKKQGFELYALENGHADETKGKLLQVDGIFVNQLFK